jgi:hypothetical protein
MQGVAAKTGDFYEDDEPIEDILAAWERSPKGLTAPPRRGVNVVLQVGAGTQAAAVGLTHAGSRLSLRPDQPMVATG